MEKNIVEQMKVTRDQYRCIGINTAALQSHDQEALNLLASDDSNGMVFARDSGWFVKLYDEHELNCHKGLSYEVTTLFKCALEAGYCMVEFDHDAEYFDGTD